MTRCVIVTQEPAYDRYRAPAAALLTPLVALAPGICWVRDVVAIKGGVRIYFSRKGGPMFVTNGDQIFRPGDAPVDPARPDEAGVEAKLGDRLGPQNSPEDGCSLEVVKRQEQPPGHANSI